MDRSARPFLHPLSVAFIAWKSALKARARQACVLGLSLISILGAHRSAVAGEMALTIDDLPLVDAEYFTREEQQRLFDGVLQALAAHRIVLVGFAIGSRIKPHHVAFLDAFVRAGHTIGNHTYSHSSLNDLSAVAYVDDVMRDDKSLARWLTGAKFFRYTYLETGPTMATRDSALKMLRENKYIAVPVTIDSNDWEHGLTYTRMVKRGRTDEAEAECARYIDATLKSAEAAQNLARQKLGRDVKHILLLHMNQINANALGRLLDRLASAGWKFVTVEEALTDPVYAAEDEYAGPQGLTWLDRILR